MALSKNSRGTAEQRFWKCVKKGEVENDCWLWVGYISNRYGRLRDDRMVLAHRFSYELHKGKIPMGLCVCHTCDNPPCVNPAHLWLGTNMDNVQDKVKKQRCGGEKLRGEKSPNAKLNWKKVRKIRKMYATGKYLQRELAEKFSVSERAINFVIHNLHWVIPAQKT